MKYSRYHPNFRKRRMECLTEFENKCMRCKVANRTIAHNSEDEIYIVYLHIAHVFRHEKMLEDAYIIPLCPKCHWYFDHPRVNPPESLEDWSFIGEVARYFIEEESQEIERQRVIEQAQLADVVCQYISTTGGTNDN